MCCKSEHIRDQSMFCKPGHENITKTMSILKLNVGLRHGMKMTRMSHKLHESNVKSNEK